MLQDILADLESLDEIPPDILEELQREIARNEEATRLAKQREIEAKAARERAAQSQAVMDSMKQKYDDIQTKVHTTRQTLSDATNKLGRQNELATEVERLKSAVDKASDKINQKQAAEEGDQNGPSKVDYAFIVQQLQEKLAFKDGEDRQQKHLRQMAADEIAETVRRLEEKSANVRAKIKQIALYEESLKTRQAQLIATKREHEAIAAEQEAKKKEEEALEMRLKVLEMQEKLLERKIKLQHKEKELTKKKTDCDKAEKLRLGRERKLRYAERQRLEEAMFDLRKKRDAKNSAPKPDQED